MSNTITAFRKSQWGVEATPATSTLTLEAQPTVGKTIIIGGTTYTVVASGADQAGEVNQGASAAAFQANIKAALNGTDGYNVVNHRVSCGDFTSDDATITARHPGPAGNALAFTGTFTDDSGNSATAFSGGAFARGTAVAATSVMAVETLEWDDADENLYMPQIANGLLVRNSGQAFPVQHGSRFSLGGQPVIWEQLPHWLSMAIKGDVIPTVEAGPLYRWTFTRNPAADPTPHSFTIQRRFSDGMNNIDQRVAYSMLNQLSISYAENEHLRMSAEGFGRKFESSAITPALTLPAYQIGVSALSTVYINDTWATLGNTQITGEVIGWELTIGTGFFPRATADGRADLDFTMHQMNGEEVMLGLKLTLLMDTARYATELAAAAAGALRAVRVNVAGSGNRSLTIDGLFQHNKPSLFKVGESEGQDVVELDLSEATDGTNYLSVVLDHPSVYSLA
jgi:hypothetical protein